MAIPIYCKLTANGFGIAALSRVRQASVHPAWRLTITRSLISFTGALALAKIRGTNSNKPALRAHLLRQSPAYADDDNYLL